MSESRVVATGAIIGALVGAAASYLFFTEAGKQMRNRVEPAIDELRRELGRFQKTIEKLGDMASDGLRVVEEFNAARTESSFSNSSTSH